MRRLRPADIIGSGSGLSVRQAISELWRYLMRYSILVALVFGAISSPSLGQEKNAQNSPAILASAPFDEETAKAHQRNWARRLGIPVEYKSRFGIVLQSFLEP